MFSNSRICYYYYDYILYIVFKVHTTDFPGNYPGYDDTWDLLKIQKVGFSSVMCVGCAVDLFRSCHCLQLNLSSFIETAG